MEQSISISSIERSTLLLLGNNIAFSCVSQIILTVSPLAIIESTNSVILGSLASAFCLSLGIFTSYPAGKLADSIGRKKTLLIGTVIEIIGISLLVISRLLYNNILFFTGLLIFGLGAGFFIQIRTAILDLYSQKPGQGIGYVNTSSFVGLFLAPIFIGGIAGLAILTTRTYYNIAIFLCLPLLAFSGLLIALIKLDTKTIGQGLEDLRPKIDTGSCTEKQKHLNFRPPSKRGLLPAIAIIALAVGAVSIALTLCTIILHSLHIELGLISLTLTVISFGSYGLSILSGRLVDRFERKKTLFLGGIIMGIAAILLPIGGSYLLITIFGFFVGLGGGIIAMAGQAVICDLVPIEERGSAFGAMTVGTHIASFILPITTGLLLSSIGLFSLSLLGLSIAVPVILLTFKVSS